MLKIPAVTRVVSMLKLGMAIAVALGVTACLATLPQQAEPPSGIDGRFASSELARQYQTMAALFEINGRHDTARQFNNRAALARRGQWAQPIIPSAEGDPTGKPAQAEGREILMLGLTQVMNAENALWLARAQVNYECWVETGEESCQQDFDKAMQGIVIPEDALQTKAVYFDADSSELSAETRDTLAGIANMVRMNKMVNIRLVGSSDHGKRNASMALRRGIAVRNVLAQMGLSPDRIIVEGEDHSDTLLSQQMRENTDAAEMRRVDIILEPVFGYREEPML